MAALVGLSMAMGGMAPNRNHYQPEVTGELPDKPIPNGAKEFEFEDGFTCIAINQKSADKKHNKWQQKNKN